MTKGCILLEVQVPQLVSCMVEIWHCSHIHVAIFPIFVVFYDAQAYSEYNIISHYFLAVPARYVLYRY